MATQSFNMLWNQKKLLIYLGLLALINISAKLIITNISNGAPFFSLFKIIHHHIGALPLWTAPLETMVVLCIANGITIFFTVSLLHHISDMMHDRPSSIRINFANGITKIKTIAWWTLLSSTIEIGTNFMIERASSHEIYIAGYLVIATLIIAWLLISFFIPPLIAIENQPLIALIKTSAFFSKETIVQIIGGECWFGLMIMLISTPFLLIWLLSSQPILNPIVPALGLFSAEILVKCWIATAHNIFKMILLQNKKQ